MARRMFSAQIVDSDAFLDMSPSAQNLYFHLGMRADDDGFVGNPKKILKMVGGNDDDLKILLAKRFILGFESGVVVIKHWLIHNQIRKDRYNGTQYLDEKKMLQIKDNKSYTEIRQPVGNQLATQDSIGKDSIGKKDTSDKSQVNIEISEIIDTFKIINENYKTFFANKTQRKAVISLLSMHSRQDIEKYIYLAKFSFNNQYFPNFISPYELQMKWAKIDKFCTTKQINDKRYLQDFEKYYIDLIKKNNPISEKQIVEATIGGRKVKYELDK